MGFKLPKGNKFHARRAVGWSGRMYDSKAERDRANELALLVKAGEIRNLREQHTVELEQGIRYKPDFEYEVKEFTREPGVILWRMVYEDVKGVTTERFRMVCLLWRLHGPGPLRILKRASSKSPFKVVKTIPGGG